MFSAIKLKLYAAGAFVLAILAYYAKSLRRENKELKHKEKIKDKIEEIHEQQITDEQEILNEEKSNIENFVEKRAKFVNPRDRRDRASRL